MAKEQSMAFYRTFYDVASLLPERSRCKVLTAMLDYYYEDVEPDLTQNEAKVFEVVRGRIDKAKRCRNSAGTSECTSEGTSEGYDEGSDGETLAMTFGQSGSESMSLSEENHTPGDQPAKSAKRRFAKPTVEEVAAYAAEKGYRGFDAERFWNFYESKGWMVGKNKMTNWKSAVSNWAGRDERKVTRRYADYD